METLLRHGVEVPNSCRAGACQSCLLRSAHHPDPLPETSQKGLKSTLIEQGYFLSCVCLPNQDMVIEPAGGLELKATIESLEHLTPTVLRLRLRPTEPFDYRAGQYVTLLRPDGLARSYSLASLPVDGTLELHVRRTERGQMSGWLFNQARENESVSIRGPAGNCFYTLGNPQQPFLLAGTGTGLAPLLGICRDALHQGHTGPISLYHGALRKAGLYCRAELNQLESAYPNFRYHPVVLENDEATDGIRSGTLDQAIAADLPKLAGWRGFICGDPSIVRRLRKKLFLAGMASRDIYADEFVEAPVR